VVLVHLVKSVVTHTLYIMYIYIYLDNKMDKLGGAVRELRGNWREVRGTWSSLVYPSVI
jgi:hypothetical protein